MGVSLGTSFSWIPTLCPWSKNACLRASHSVSGRGTTCNDVMYNDVMLFCNNCRHTCTCSCKCWDLKFLSKITQDCFLLLKYCLRALLNCASSSNTSYYNAIVMSTQNNARLLHTYKLLHAKGIYMTVCVCMCTCTCFALVNTIIPHSGYNSHTP